MSTFSRNPFIVLIEHCRHRRRLALSSFGKLAVELLPRLSTRNVLRSER